LLKTIADRKTLNSHNLFNINIIMEIFVKTVFVFLLGIASQLTFAQVTTDADKTADFGKYKTYAWLKEDIRVGNNPIYNSQLINRNIRENVEMELAKRDMTLAPDSAKPDLLVSFHTYTEKKHVSYGGGPAYFAGGFHRGWGYCPYGYGNWPYAWNGGFRSYNYTEGTLIIDVVDARTKQLVWRGSAAGVVDNPRGLEREIAQGVHKIMKHYPVPVDKVIEKSLTTKNH
jgi:hypothetical protein